VSEPSQSDAHLTPTYSGRGFAYWEPIRASYGAQIDVHESSAASEPHIWIDVAGDCHLDEPPHPHPGVDAGIAKGSAAAHLSIEAAKRFRDQLDAAIKHSEERFGG
jgi:hypothetical protein